MNKKIIIIALLLQTFSLYAQTKTARGTIPAYVDFEDIKIGVGIKPIVSRIDFITSNHFRRLGSNIDASVAYKPKKSHVGGIANIGLTTRGFYFKYPIGTQQYFIDYQYFTTNAAVQYFPFRDGKLAINAGVQYGRLLGVGSDIEFFSNVSFYEKHYWSMVADVEFRLLKHKNTDIALVAHYNHGLTPIYKFSVTNERGDESDGSASFKDIGLGIVAHYHFLPTEMK